MGRLQRKKVASNKKKKKKNLNGAISPQAKSPQATQRIEVSPDSSRDTKKRRVVSQTKSPSAAKSVPRKLKNGYLDKALQFLREVKMELKKVAWPTRKQTIGSAVVVILLVMIISLFLGVVDIGWSNIFRIVLQ